MFLSEIGGSGHLEGMQHLNARIGEAGGARFWFHAPRNCFTSVADRDLMLPPSLTKRLVNHAPPQDVTEGYAADWTMVHATERVWFKWLRRRSQRKRLTWERFGRLLERFPLPRPRVAVRIWGG